MKWIVMTACGILCLVLLVGSTGCKSSMNADQMKVAIDQADAFIEALERGKFKGHAEFQHGGSLLGFHMTNSFELGPRTVLAQFEGDLDFTGNWRQGTGTPLPVPVPDDGN